MIGSTTNTAEYVGNASTVTAYTIPFRYDDPSWVKIIATDSAGVATTLALTTDFLLAGDGLATTGTFTTTAAIPATTTLSVYREAPGLQSLNLETGEPLPSGSVEAQLDRLAMASTDRVTLRLLNSRLPLVLTAPPSSENLRFIAPSLSLDVVLIPAGTYNSALIYTTTGSQTPSAGPWWSISKVNIGPLGKWLFAWAPDGLAPLVDNVTVLSDGAASEPLLEVAWPSGATLTEAPLPTPSHIGQLAIIADGSVFIATSLSPITWLQLSN